MGLTFTRSNRFRRSSWLLALVAGQAVASVAGAQTVWTGGGATSPNGFPDFNNAANWGGTAPASGLAMTFDGTATAPATVALTAPAAVGSLNFATNFNPTNTLTLGVDAAATGALTLGQGLPANPTLLSNAAGTGTVTIQGATLGTTPSALLTLSVAQAGSISVATGGTLAITTTIAPASGATTSGITKTGGGTLVLGGGTSTFVGLTISGGTVRLDSSTYNALGTLAGGLTLNGGTLLLNNVALGATSRGVVLQGNATTNNTFDVPTGHDVTFSGVISGTGRLVKTGTGRMYIGSSTTAPIPNNTFSGGVLIQSGTLRIGTGASLGTGPVTIGATGGGNASLLSNLAGYTYANDLTVAAGSGGTITLGSTSTAAFTSTFSGLLSLNDNLTLTSATPADRFVQLTGVVSGAGALTKIGVGTIRLSGANTFSGAIAVNEGTLEARTNTSFGVAANAITVNDAVLAFDTLLTGTTTGSAAQPVTLASANSRVNVASGETWTMNGAYTGTGALTKIGTGTMYLASASNSFTGPVSLTEGNIRVNGTHNNAGNYTTVAGTILGGAGTINLSTGSSLSIAGSLSPGGVGSGIGTLRVNNGPLSLNNAGTPGTYSIDVNPDAAQRADVLQVAGSLIITDANLAITVVNPGSPWTGPAIIATYGTLTGTFANEATLAANGFTLDYNYQGLNQIALVTIPEPSTLAGAGLLGAMLLRRRRRRPTSN